MAKGKPVLSEGHGGYRRSRVRVLSWHDTSEGQREFEALQAKLKQYEELLSTCLAGLHLIQADARRIERFHADPNLNVEDEARKIQYHRSELHHEIVWVRNHGPDETVCRGHKHGHDVRVCAVPSSVLRKMAAEEAKR